MIKAIEQCLNWQSGNTAVVFDDPTRVSEVYLHGNKIAEVSDDTMTIFDGGYQSTTTKSRLNALCSEFCVTGEKVFQKNFQWYVRLFVGAINGKNVYKNETFTNGYTFAQSLIDSPGDDLKLTNHKPYLTLFMSKSDLLAALETAENGNDILLILEAIEALY